MPPLQREEEMDDMDSGNDSVPDNISTEIFEIFVMEVSLIRTLIEENHVIK